MESDSDGEGVYLLHTDSDDDDDDGEVNDETNPYEGETSSEDEFRQSVDNSESSDDHSLDVEQSSQHRHGDQRSVLHNPGDCSDSSDDQDAIELQGKQTISSTSRNIQYAGPPSLQEMNLLQNVTSRNGSLTDNSTNGPPDRTNQQQCSKDVYRQQYSHVVNHSDVTASGKEDTILSSTNTGPVSIKKQKTSSAALGGLKKGFLFTSSPSIVSHPAEEISHSNDSLCLPVIENDLLSKQALLDNEVPLKDVNHNANSRSGGYPDNMASNSPDRTNEAVDRQQHSDLAGPSDVSVPRKEETDKGGKRTGMARSKQKTISGAFGGLKRGFLFGTSPSTGSQSAYKTNKSHSTGNPIPFIKKQVPENDSLGRSEMKSALKINQTLPGKQDTSRYREDQEANGCELQLYSQPLPGAPSGISSIGGTISTGIGQVSKYISDTQSKDILLALASSRLDTTIDTGVNREMHVHLTQNIIKDSSVNMGGKTVIKQASKMRTKQPRKQTAPSAAQRLRPWYELSSFGMVAVLI